jgi:hypothetical protein
MLNSHGAAADIVVYRKVRDSNNSDWQEVVNMYTLTHTTLGGEELTPDDGEADRKQLVGKLNASQNHSKALVTMVHFSNRGFSEDLSSGYLETRMEEICCCCRMESVMGPLCGRKFISKGFCGNRAKAMPFFYLTRAPAVDIGCEGVIPWMGRLFR